MKILDSDKKLKKALKKVEKDISSLKETHVSLTKRFQYDVEHNTKNVDFDLIQEISLCTAEIAKKSSHYNMIEKELKSRKSSSGSDLVQLSDKKLKKMIKKAKAKISSLKEEKEVVNSEIERKDIKAKIKVLKSHLKELKHEANERSEAYGRPTGLFSRLPYKDDSFGKHLLVDDTDVRKWTGVIDQYGIIRNLKEEKSKNKDLFAKPVFAGVSSVHQDCTRKLNINKSGTMQGIKENADKSKVLKTTLESLFRNATDKFEGDKRTPTVNVDDFLKQQKSAAQKFALLRSFNKITDKSKTFVVRKSRDDIKTIIKAPIPVLNNEKHEYSIGDAIVFATKDGKSVYGSPFIVRYLIHEGPNDAVGLEKVTSYP